MNEDEKRKAESTPSIADVKRAVDSTGKLLEEVRGMHSDAEAGIKTLAEVKDQVEKLDTESWNKSIDNLKAVTERVSTLETAQDRPATANSEKEDGFDPDTFAIWAGYLTGRRLEVSEAGIEKYNKYSARLGFDEVHALTSGDDTNAGYLAAPEDVSLDIIKNLTEMDPIRQIAKVVQTRALSYSVITRTGIPSGQWPGETGTTNDSSSSMTYGKKIINTHVHKEFVGASLTIIEDSVVNMEAEIRLNLTEALAQSEEAEFVNGSGAGRPQGILTNADINTDTSSGHATELTADGLIDLYAAIKTAYVANSSWLMSRTTWSAARKLKDGSGRFILDFHGGIVDSPIWTILGRPVYESVTMPTLQAASKSVVFGDFKKAYTIVDRIGLSVLRDPYTKKTTDIVEFMFRTRVGGGVVLPEALYILTTEE